MFNWIYKITEELEAQGKAYVIANAQVQVVDADGELTGESYSSRQLSDLSLA